MGTDVRSFGHGGEPTIEPMLRARIAELEQRWSRFVASSEISALNRRAGEPSSVSDDTLLLCSRAVQASMRARGWFDPLLLDELEGAGYAASFDTGALSWTPLILDESPPAPAARTTAPERVVIDDWPARASRIEIDTERRVVTIPAGTRFDPGGIGKGLAADLVAAAALGLGAHAAFVSAGGDITCAGPGPTGGWPIVVEDPFDTAGSPLFELRIPWGAVATSTIARRRWISHDGVRHHLIDPTTGLPGTSELVAVTVIAGECWMAESLAKAALLAGPEAGRMILDANGVEGLFIDRAGRHRTTEGFEAYVR